MDKICKKSKGIKVRKFIKREKKREKNPEKKPKKREKYKLERKMGDNTGLREHDRMNTTELRD